MVFNLLFRAVWIITISPASFGLDVNHAFVLLAVGAAEILRRCVWNIFRLENEHLNNVGKYRAVNIIPLPLSPGHRQSSDEEDPGVVSKVPTLDRAATVPSRASVDPTVVIQRQSSSNSMNVKPSSSVNVRRVSELSPIPIRAIRKWSKRKSSQSSDEDAANSRKFRQKLSVDIKEEEEEGNVVVHSRVRKVTLNLQATTDTEHTSDKEDNHEHVSSDADKDNAEPHAPETTNAQPELTLLPSSQDSSTGSSPGLVPMAPMVISPLPQLQLDNGVGSPQSSPSPHALQLSESISRLPVSALSSTTIPNVQVSIENSASFSSPESESSNVQSPFESPS